MIFCKSFKFVYSCMLYVFLMVSLNEANAANANMPMILRGVWTHDTEMGQRQCIDYKKHRSQEYLVDAILIGKRKIIDTAEYGENDQYELTGLKSLSRGVWQLEVLADFYPQGEEEKKPLLFTLTLKKKRLYWTSYYTENEQKAQKTWVYYRCK